MRPRHRLTRFTPCCSPICSATTSTRRRYTESSRGSTGWGRSRRRTIPPRWTGRTACLMPSLTSPRCTGGRSSLTKTTRHSSAARGSTCCRFCSGWIPMPRGCPEPTGRPSLVRWAGTVWLFRSFLRVEELAPAVASILERWIRHSKAISKIAAPELRGRMERLAAATEGRYQNVADLARTVRFHYLDEPEMRKAASMDYAQMQRHLEALRADPGGPGRQRRIGALLSSGLPLQAMVLRQRLGSRRPTMPTDAYREVLLEVVTRRFYQIRDLRDLTFSWHEGHLLCSADYEVNGRPIHLVVAHLPLAEMPGLDTAVASHLADVEPGRNVVVDAHTWRYGETPSDADTGAQIANLLRDCEFGRRLWRLDITVTSVRSGSGRIRSGSQSVTFRQRRDGRFAEELIYRNLHPMIAKRFDLWRLGNFKLQRLPSAADVHVFHGVALDNPEDHRLFALAEVRDLVQVRDTSGAVSYPRLELVGLSAISAMRHALTTFPAGDPPIANRIVMYVLPPWDIPPEKWPDIARSFGPLAIA